MIHRPSQPQPDHPPDPDRAGEKHEGPQYPPSLRSFLRKRSALGSVDYRLLRETSPGMYEVLEVPALGDKDSWNLEDSETVSLRDLIEELEETGWEPDDSDLPPSGDAKPADMEEVQGTPCQAPRYIVERHLGSGGTSTVLQAWDQDLGRRVAVKVLLRGGSEGKGSSGVPRLQELARFLEEAQITAQLEHPSIISVHDVGFDSAGHPFFTMGRVRGRNFTRIIELVSQEEDGWNLPRAIGVLVKACQGVAYAHSKGVVHRDLKPDNIMVGRFGEVYIMDWGLAKAAGARDSRGPGPAVQDESRICSNRNEAAGNQKTPIDDTVDGSVFGTPVYMSPEQAEGRVGDIDERSDVYSLGSILYTVLAGRYPYYPEEPLARMPSILGQVLAGPPKPIDAINPKAPGELVAICEKAMDRNREDRYGSSLELAEDLQAYLECRVVKAFQSGSIAEFSKLVQRNKRTSVIVAATFLVLVACVGALIVARKWLDDAIVAAQRPLSPSSEPAGRSELSGLSGLLQADLAFDHSGVPMAIVDDGGRLQRHNPPLSNLLGYGDEELDGVALPDLATDASFEESLSDLLKSPRNELRLTGTWRTKSGGTIRREVLLRKVPAGESFFAVVTFLDGGP